MRHIFHKIVAVAISLMISQSGMASDLLNTKVAPQSLHVAGSAQPIPTPLSSVAGNTNHSINKSSVAWRDPTKTNAVKFKSLTQQLSVLNQQMLLFQQNSDQRMDTVVQQNVALKKSNIKLNQSHVFVESTSIVSYSSCPSEGQAAIIMGGSSVSSTRFRHYTSANHFHGYPRFVGIMVDFFAFP